MENNSAMISFGDLMSILLACFMLVSALLATKVAQEFSTKVQLLEKQASATAQADSPGESSLFLSVTKAGRYVLEGKSLKQKKEFAVPSLLVNVLKQLNPPNLYIRGDKGVPYGTVLSVLMDCRALGIRTALSVDTSSGGGL